MPKFIVQLGDAIDRNTPLPDGEYVMRIDATPAREIREGREGGTPYFVLRLVVEEPIEYARRQMIANFMLSGTMAWRTQQLMEATGQWRDEYTTSRLGEVDTDALHGRVIRVRLRRNKNNSNFTDIVSIRPFEPNGESVMPAVGEPTTPERPTRMGVF